MPSKLLFSLLGTPEIRHGDQTIVFETNKSQALLIYLVLNRGWYARDLLAELLWPDMPNAQARKNLRDGLLQARAAVGSWVVADTQRVRFAHELPHEVDIVQFSEGLAQGQVTQDLPKVQTALNLYYGDFLQGFHVRKAAPFEEWITQKREELYTQRINALEWLAEQHVIRHDYSAGLTTNHWLLKLEPWRESAHRRQMQLLALSGRSGEALVQYNRCQRVLDEELGVQPAIETVALYEQIRAGKLHRSPDKTPNGSQSLLDPQSVHQTQSAQVEKLHKQPVTGPPVAFTHNLPRQMTPLIGRQVEIAKLREKLLDPYYPLLTLSGEGGVGKTRLAVAVAETVYDHFSDGVWFVSLADLHPTANLPEQLAAAIGKALQITFTGTETLVNQLLSQLRPKQLLLILDNFEHVQQGADFVLNLLQTVHGIKVLVTSRRRLNFLAEYVFPVSGLMLPDQEIVDKATNGLIDLNQLLTYPSVALFVERAGRSRSHFRLTTEDQAAVLQIGQLVAGLPLGLELAAAQLRYLSCTQVAAMLQHNYSTLATTLPDLPPRHRSIQAVITYSWQLLSTEESAILVQCAVFRGGFTIAAAQAVANATPVVLTSLEDQSLLHQTTDGRFEIHELVRQYAAEQLQKQPKDAYRVSSRHSAYYANFLAALEQSQNRDHAAQRAIRADLDNIRTAWFWAVEQAKVTELARALKSLARFYYLVGFLNEAVSMLQPAVTRVRGLLAKQSQPVAELQRLLARLLIEAAFFDAMLDQRTLAEQSITEAIQLAQVLADPALEALGYVRLGDIAWSRADYQRHRAAYTHSLTLVRQHELRSLEAHCLSNLGMNHDEYGEYTEAIACYEAALAIAHQLENRQQESIVYHNLSVSHKMLGSFGQALDYHQRTLQLTQELGDQEGIGFAYLNQGSTLCMLGEHAQAQAALEQALMLFQQMNLARLEAKTRLAFGHLYEQLGDYATAHNYAEQALVLAQSGNYQVVQAETLTLLGYILTAQSMFSAAKEAFREARSLWQTIDQPGGQLLAQAGSAQIYLAEGNLADAQMEVDEILARLDGVSLNTAHRSERIFWICHQVLTATGDSRAVTLLQRGCQLLQAQAATLADPTLQQSFLQNVTVRRELLAARDKLYDHTDC